MVADDNLPKEFGYIEEMNTDKSISGIDFESFKEISSRNNWFTKVLGFYKINSSMYGLSISKDRIETFLVDLSRNLIYCHPFNGLPILFKPLFSCGLKEYYLFPPELFQGAVGDLINKKEDVEKILESKGITEKNGKLAIWLSEEKTDTLQ